MRHLTDIQALFHQLKLSFSYFSLASLRKSVDLINERLRGTKRLDLYESARVDPNVPIEDAIRNLAQLVKEGKFEHIGLSECRAETLRRANAVSFTRML